MRSFLTFGFISLVTAAAVVACGDDSGSPSGTAGAGGSAGASGGAGTAGAGGGAGSAGTGSAGTSSGGSAGTVGVVTVDSATCTGCVEVAVPVSGANSAANVADQAIFQFTLPAATDFSNAVITWRIAAVGANNDNLYVSAFAQDGPPLHANYDGVFPVTAPAYKVLSAANFPLNTFEDIVLDLSAYRGLVAADAGADAATVDAGADAGDAGDAGAGTGTLDPGLYDKSVTLFYGLNVGSTGTFTGTGIARIAIDSVTITGVNGQNHTFDTTVEGLTLNTYQLPPGTPQPVHH